MRDFLKSVGDFFRGLFSANSCDQSRSPSPKEIRSLAKEAVHDSGAADYIKQLMATKDEGERQKIRDTWEAKMTARKNELSLNCHTRGG
jgi:predicted nucleotidyltransferase